MPFPQSALRMQHVTRSTQTQHKYAGITIDQASELRSLARI